MKTKHIIYFIAAITFFSCELKPVTTTTNSDNNEFAYTAIKAASKIVIDGINDEVDWKTANVASFDHYYYHDSIYRKDDEQQTEFRMLWDANYVYAFFKCSDKYITARETVRDGEPYLDDCAEIFLSPVSEQIDMHMGFEINLFKVSNDFWYMTDYFNGQTGVLKAFDPDFEVEVVVNGTVNDNSDIDQGWTLEMAIPLKLFYKLDTYAPVQAGAKWTFLALRQERNEIEGARRITSTLFPADYEESFDVHASSSFGYLNFADKK